MCGWKYSLDLQTPAYRWQRFDDVQTVIIFTPFLQSLPLILLTTVALKPNMLQCWMFFWIHPGIALYSSSVLYRYTQCSCRCIVHFKGSTKRHITLRWKLLCWFKIQRPCLLLPQHSSDDDTCSNHWVMSLTNIKSVMSRCRKFSKTQRK